MDARARLLGTLAYMPSVPPPRFESEFSPETVALWRNQGCLDESSPEAALGLDVEDEWPVGWRRARGDKRVVDGEDGLTAFRRLYDPDRLDRLLPDEEAPWPPPGPSHPGAPRYVAPWNEGFLQVLGIADAASLNRALTLLCERPALAEAQMDHYATGLERLISRALESEGPAPAVDYALYYEPIASNHGPVLAPAMYRRFVAPALRRVIDCLRRHGIAYHFIWSAGRVDALIPVWLDCGINGVALNRGAECGLGYGVLRRAFGRELRLMGGVSWQAALEGGPALERELAQNARPLLEQGGYIPHLDDTVRVYMPFDVFRHYREHLDAVISDVYGA